MEEDLLGLTPTATEPAVQASDNNQAGESKSGLVYHFSTEKLQKFVAKKVAHLAQTLNQDVIDMVRLRECLSEGIPDEAALLREYSWKLVLGYLPPQKNKWAETISRQQKTYQGLIDMFLPANKFQDYPLFLKKGHPRFKELQEDHLLWQQIEKDTSRTHAQFSFFSTECAEIMIPYLTSTRREKFKLINGQDEGLYKQFLENKEKQRKTYRYDYMTRILYIYSRLNPKIQYVQGMNEILAPIFYLVNISSRKSYIEQASCFFMFNSAISDIIELHIKDLDKSQNGIYGKLNQVNEMLVVIEPIIWSRLDKLKIDPFYYCFRWITLLYAQEFDLFDTLRIWESIFSADDRPKFTYFIAIAIIMSCKEVIVSEQFTVVLEHLQNLKENVNVDRLVEKAKALYLEFGDKDFSEHAKLTKKALSKKGKEEKGEGGLFKKFTSFVNEYF